VEQTSQEPTMHALGAGACANYPLVAKRQCTTHADAICSPRGGVTAGPVLGSRLELRRYPHVPEEGFRFQPLRSGRTAPIQRTGSCRRARRPQAPQL
jgi:hypothetical protein